MANNQIQNCQPSGWSHRNEIRNARSVEEAQMVAMALQLQVEAYRAEFRAMGIWPPEMAELPTLYPFARHVLRQADCDSGQPEALRATDREA